MIHGKLDATHPHRKRRHHITRDCKPRLQVSGHFRNHAAYQRAAHEDADNDNTQPGFVQAFVELEAPGHIPRGDVSQELLGKLLAAPANFPGVVRVLDTVLQEIGP